MMPYLKQHIVDLALRHDRTMYLYVQQLNNHGVCAVEGKKNLYLDIKFFLQSQKVVHQCNNRQTIWLPELEGTIKTFLEQ